MHWKHFEVKKDELKVKLTTVDKLALNTDCYIALTHESYVITFLKNEPNRKKNLQNVTSLFGT